MSAYAVTGDDLRAFLALPRVQTPPFFHCPCGKLHTASFIGPLTTCPTCERNLSDVLRLILGLR